MALQPRPVNGPVAAEVTLKRMLVRVSLLEVDLAANCLNFNQIQCVFVHFQPDTNQTFDSK